MNKAPSAPLDYAIRYRTAGLSPVPIHPDGSKRPTVAWQSCQTSPVDELTIPLWFAGQVGIGICGGSGSGGAECIDLDSATIAGEYRALVDAAAPGLLAKLTIIETPRPGYHLWYRCEHIGGNEKLAMEADGRTTLIETRGQGGYALVPGGAPEAHPTGKPYVHRSGPSLERLATITPEERETLFRAARALDRSPQPEPERHQQNGYSRGGVSPGDDYAARVSWDDLLLPGGWSKVFTAGGLTHWRRPGKTTGTSATTGATSTSGTELLCVFSSNAHPFPGPGNGRSCSSHSKFDAFARLNHGGDHSAAAKALAGEGYGDRPKRQGMPDLRPDDLRDDEPTPDRYDPSPQEPQLTFARITSRELASGDFDVDYLIKDTLVDRQPLIVAGSHKTLKTSIMIDAAVSLSIGGHFLGRLKVSRACRVAMMTGESGLSTIQETARRISVAAGYHLADLDNLIWSTDLPQFGNPRHLDAMRRFLTDDAIEVVFIDPAYLCMPGGDAGNLMAQGVLLRSMAEVCDSVGCTMVLAHHIKRGTGANPYDPPELHHIAWAGFSEFARQWWLIGRRERYIEKSGDHKLWLSIGGSAGHSGLWAVDVAEGVRSEFEDRKWGVELLQPSEVRSDEAERREDAKATREAARRERESGVDQKAVVQAMTKIGAAETQTEISAVARISGARTKAALVDLMTAGIVVDGGPITKDNNRVYKVTYALTDCPE